ncbi:hypothetical protein C4580_01570 [Candidatus Woesearchaeota archaeon]|nr:MAG: hypothetical protein C4580_01570 [Candidatus Woesearchaeota archaeon]
MRTCARVANVWRGTLGLGAKPPDLQCRKNGRKSDEIPSPTEKQQKVPVLKNPPAEPDGKKCRNFWRILSQFSEKTTVEMLCNSSLPKKCARIDLMKNSAFFAR